MNEEIISGLNPVKEALRGSRKIYELFVADGAADQRIGKVTELASANGVPVRRRSRVDLTRLAGTDHHQGIAIRIESFKYADLDDTLDAVRDRSDDVMILLLDGIQDPHNLGALIRSASCAGAVAVVIPKDRAAGVTAAAEKVAAGAAETLPVAQVTNIATTLERLKAEGFWIYGADAESRHSLYQQKLRGKVALVIGSEGEGIRPLVRKKCDVIFSIPIMGCVGSLNASVAGGVAMFEVVRQRQ